MVMIRSETEMKDSGVQWLGNIPKEWSVGKVKHEFYATKTIVGDKVNHYERLALTLNGVIKRSKDAGDGLQPEKFDGYQILKEHELVFKLIDLANVSTSRVGLSPYTGIVSPAYIVLHHRKDMNPRYGEYYFLSMWMNEVFNHIGGDGVRSALNAKDLLNIPYLKVSLDEQQAIADYLDKTCSKIDKIIVEAKENIDEYKELKKAVLFEVMSKGIRKHIPMKYSGVDWLEAIPFDWNFMKITYILDYNDIYPIGDGDHGMIKTESYCSEGIPYIRVQNIGWGTPLLLDNVVYISEDDNEKIKSSQLKPNDVLFVKTGGTIGKTAIVPDSLPVSNTTSHVGKITVSPEHNPKFVFYMLSSFIGYKQFWDIACMKATRPELSINEIKQIKVLMPTSRTEEDEIVAYLDKILPDYDLLITEKESLINDLEAYKKSLIYEVVTGKRRVV